MAKALALSAVIFCIAGILGLIFTFRSFAWGSGEAIQGAIAFGTFLLVGFVTILTMFIATGEE